MTKSALIKMTSKFAFTTAMDPLYRKALLRKYLYPRMKQLN